LVFLIRLKSKLAEPDHLDESVTRLKDSTFTI
jgi:hypothetical protein